MNHNIYGYPCLKEQRRGSCPGLFSFITLPAALALLFCLLSVFLAAYIIGSRLLSDGSGDIKTGALIARSEAYSFIKKHDTKLAQKYYQFLYQKEHKK